MEGLFTMGWRRVHWNLCIQKVLEVWLLALFAPLFGHWDYRADVFLYHTEARALVMHCDCIEPLSEHWGLTCGSKTGGCRTVQVLSCFNPWALYRMAQYTKKSLIGNKGLRNTTEVIVQTFLGNTYQIVVVLNNPFCGTSLVSGLK